LSLTTSEDQPLTALTAELKRSSDQLDFCTREFQLWLSVQQPGFRLHHEYVLIQDLFREAEESFRNLLNYNNNNLHVMMGEDIHTWTDRQLLKTILYNLIDNANKRTEKGLIGLMVYLYKDKLTIRVSDSGKEMTLHELHSLQGLLEVEKHLLETKSIDTLGYSTVPDLVRVLKGHIEVKYTLNTGTTVSLILLAS
jgi:signal transduction histidine kinase